VLVPDFDWELRSVTNVVPLIVKKKTIFKILFTIHQDDFLDKNKYNQSIYQFCYLMFLINFSKIIRELNLLVEVVYEAGDFCLSILVERRELLKND
jgi:hypothetical protein